MYGFESATNPEPHWLKVSSPLRQHGTNTASLALAYDKGFSHGAAASMEKQNAKLTTVTNVYLKLCFSVLSSI